MTESVFGGPQVACARRALGLSEDYTIFYQSVDIDFLSDEARQGLISDYSVDEGTIEDAMIQLALPKGSMVVGMQDKHREHIVYGIVNFLGCKPEAVKPDGGGGGGSAM